MRVLIIVLLLAITTACEQKPNGKVHGIPACFPAETLREGDAKTIPDHIRIFNKVGDAYGFLTDAAYIVDFKNGIEFILSATIYTNENQTFNDNNYEYDEIGLPFLRDLGQAIYEVELERQREHKPDLSRFRFPDRDS